MTELGVTPWVDNAFRPVWERVVAAAPQRSWAPTRRESVDARGRLRRKVEELGCGHYGCVMPTSDPRIVCKLTTDVTEAAFVAAALQLGDQPEGLVKYESVYRLPDVTHRRRPVFVLWREAADAVGLAAVERALWEIPKEQYQYEANAVLILGRYLQHFRDAAADARTALQAGDRAQKLADCKRFEQAAWERTFEIEWEWRTTSVRKLLEREGGLERLALDLAMCRSMVEHMENTYGCDLIGGALGHYLERGLLLADVHQANVGTTARSGRICVITDPGHAVWMDPKWERVDVRDLP